MTTGNIIEISHIARTYTIGSETIHALRDVSLNVMKNEYVALMGPSGSGKSTLMNMLGCLDTPSSGEYVLNGKSVARMSDDELAEVRNKEIGFVFQTFNLLPRSTALENVMLPLVYAGMSSAARKEKAMRVLEQVGLKDRVHHKPNELSGGQRQRVAVARALVNDPAIILADEPTGNLDSKNAEDLHKLFFDLRKELNQTFVIVTHNEKLANMADRKLVMNDGRLIS
jgi:putative ABC transport system ATP-binding protein